jgi:hypothetical protein
MHILHMFVLLVSVENAIKSLITEVSIVLVHLVDADRLVQIVLTLILLLSLRAARILPFL